MSLRIGLWLLILTINSFLIKSNNSQIKLIKSYAQRQIMPPEVLLYTCWDKFTTLKVLQELTKSKIFARSISDFSKIAITNPSTYALNVIDSDCRNFNLLIENAQNLNLFKSPNRWLVLTHQLNPVPGSIKLLLDSNFVIAAKSADNYHLTAIFKYSENDTSFSQNDIGTFSPEIGDFLYYNNFIIGANRSDLQGTTIRVSYVITKPEYPFDFQDYRYRHIDSPCRVGYILTRYMLEKINSSGFFVAQPTWGYKAPNSSTYADGMFGDIQKGNADIAGCVGFYTLERLKIIEYLSVPTPSDMKFLMKAPPLSYVHNLFTLPFQKTVWYCFYVITGVTTLIFYIIVKCEGKNQKLLFRENNVDNIKPKFFDVVMAQVGAISQQGSDAEPLTISGRISLFIILLIMMFLYTSYSANIVVLLQSTSDSIRTVKDLLYSKIELGAEDVVYNHYFLKNQEDPLRQTLYKKKIANNFMNVTEGIQRLRNGFFGFHLETSGAYKIIKDTFQEHEKCGLLEVDYMNSFYPSLSIKRGSHFKEFVKIGYKRVHEVGIRQRQINRIYFKKPQCLNKGGNFINVGLTEVYFPFLIFGAGLLTACFLLIMELIHQRYYQKKNSK